MFRITTNIGLKVTSVNTLYIIGEDDNHENTKQKPATQFFVTTLGYTNLSITFEGSFFGGVDKVKKKNNFYHRHSL